MKEQKGFTLIEILVSVAVLSIVVLAIGTAMVTGSRSFAKGNADASVQKEAQLAVNQVEDMIIDINGSVDLQMYTGGTLIDLDSVTTEEEMAEKDALADKKELVLYNAVKTDAGTEYTKEIVTWERDAERITYSLWNVNYDSASETYDTIEPHVYKDQLLAENVTSFSIDLSDVKQEQLQDGTEVDVLRSVQITAGYRSSNNMIVYATTPLIALRNRLVKSGDPALGLTPPVDETQPFSLYISGASDTYYLAVPIIDRVTEVECDKLYNIYAMVNMGGTINDSVDFSIEEVCQSSISSNGLLSVGELETNEYLTIVATHKDDPTRIAKGVVKVLAKSNKRLIAAHIIPDKLESFKPKYLSIVETEGFEQQDLNELQYTWKVSVPEYFEPFDGTKERLSLLVDQTNEMVYGKTVQITLEVYSPSLNRRVTDTVSYTIDAKGSTGDSNLVRAGQYWYYFIANCANPNFDFYMCDAQGNRVEDQSQIENGNIKLNAGTWGNYDLTVSTNVPWDQSYYVRVLATDNDGLLILDRIMPIAAVRMYPNTQTANDHGSFYFYISSCVHDRIQLKSFFDFECTVITEDGDTTDVTVDIANWIGTNNVYPDATGLYMVQGQYVVSGDAGKIKSIRIRISSHEYPSIYTYSTIVF